MNFCLFVLFFAFFCISVFLAFFYIYQKISKSLRRELEAAYSDMNSKLKSNEQVEEDEEVTENRRNNRFFKDEEEKGTSTSTSISNRNNGKNYNRDLNKNRNKFVPTDNLQFRSAENSKIEDDLRDFYGFDNNIRGSMKLSNKVNNNSNYNNNNNSYNSTTGLNPLSSLGNNKKSNNNKSRSRSRNSQLSMDTEEVAESQLLELNHEIGNFTSHRTSSMSVSLQPF